MANTPLFLFSTVPFFHDSSIPIFWHPQFSMASRTPALELRNVSYVGNAKVILRSINWTVRQGDDWVLLGPNGSGKNTLLKIASGSLWPNAGGEVRRKGRALITLPELRKSIGW